MESHSNQLGLVATSLLVTMLAVTPLLGQSGQGERDRQEQEARIPDNSAVQIVKHDTIIGASVTNGREGEAQELLGSISDLVLDTRNGQVRYAVLASGGTLGMGKRQTPVSWDALTWDAKDSRFALAMTKEAISKMPEFDRKNLHRPDGSKGAATTAGADAETTNVGSADAGEHASARDPVAAYLLASKIGDCAVLVGAEEFGSGDSLFIEPKSGVAPFLTVSSGGVIGIGETNYIVPWAALRFVRPMGEEQLQILLRADPKAFEAAPKLGGEGADVNNAQFRQKIYGVYGVERPTFETATPRQPQRDLRR